MLLYRIYYLLFWYALFILTALFKSQLGSWFESSLPLENNLSLLERRILFQTLLWNHPMVLEFMHCLVHLSHEFIFLIVMLGLKHKLEHKFALFSFFLFFQEESIRRRMRNFKNWNLSNVPVCFFFQNITSLRYIVSNIAQSSTIFFLFLYLI